jgi:hypothetical protein
VHFSLPRSGALLGSWRQQLGFPPSARTGDSTEQTSVWRGETLD